MDDPEIKRRTEMVKMLFEFLKHLTTLSSGSILLIVALAEKFIKAPHLSQHLFRSVFLFCVAILTALLTMGVLSFHAGGDKLSTGAIKLFAWGLLMSAMGFFGGIALVGLSVLRELG